MTRLIRLSVNSLAAGVLGEWEDLMELDHSRWFGFDIVVMIFLLLAMALVEFVAFIS